MELGINAIVVVEDLKRDDIFIFSFDIFKRNNKNLFAMWSC